MGTVAFYVDCNITILKEHHQVIVNC